MNLCVVLETWVKGRSKCQQLCLKFCSIFREQDAFRSAPGLAVGFSGCYPPYSIWAETGQTVCFTWTFSTGRRKPGETKLANSRFAGSNTLSTGKGIKVGSTISCPILLQSQSLSSFSYTKVWWCTARMLWVQFPGPAASCVRGLTLASPETTGVGCSASTNLSPGTEVGQMDPPLNFFFSPSVTEGHGKAQEATWTAAWSVCQLT